MRAIIQAFLVRGLLSLRTRGPLVVAANGQVASTKEGGVNKMNPNMGNTDEIRPVEGWPNFLERGAELPSTRAGVLSGETPGAAASPLCSPFFLTVHS